MADNAPPTYAASGFPPEASDMLKEYNALVLRIVELNGSDDTAAATRAGMDGAIKALQECDDRVKKAEGQLAVAQAENDKGAFLKSAKDKLAAALQEARHRLDELRAQRQVYLTQEQVAIFEHSRVASLADELVATRTRVSLVVRLLFDTVFVPQNASLERELNFFVAKLCKVVNEIVSVHKASSALKDASDLILAVDDDAGKWENSRETTLHTILLNLYIVKACALVPDIITEALPTDIARKTRTADFWADSVKTFNFLPSAIRWLTGRSKQLNLIANKVVTRMIAVARSLHDFRVGFIEAARPHAAPLGGVQIVSMAILPVVIADLAAAVQMAVRDRTSLKEAQVAKILCLSRTFEDEEDFFYDF
ncbi:hypothetical protein HK101_009571 [Irineochytrium annulatum]|nr:hypothetical protein HK101_009571 [Irineochytrium annulatum]